MLACAQGPSLAAPAPLPVVETPPLPSDQSQADKRVFGVLPNHRTTEASSPFEAISGKRKLTIAAQDSFDYPIFPTAAGLAGLYQLEDQNPSFGQGMKGYGKRLSGSLADQVTGNMLTEGIIPALTHQDPRYFRLGQGRVRHRTLYALSRIFVAPMDSGHNTFNFSEWGGNSIAVAFSNAYYPDSRNVDDNVEKLLTQCAADAVSNVLKEFWPDIKRHFQRKHHEDAPGIR